MELPLTDACGFRCGRTPCNGRTREENSGFRPAATRSGLRLMYSSGKKPSGRSRMTRLRLLTSARAEASRPSCLPSSTKVFLGVDFAQVSEVGINLPIKCRIAFLVVGIDEPHELQHLLRQRSSGSRMAHVPHLSAERAMKVLDRGTARDVIGPRGIVRLRTEQRVSDIAQSIAGEAIVRQFRARELDAVARPIGRGIEDDVGKERLVLVTAFEIVDDRRVVELFVPVRSPPGIGRASTRTKATDRYLARGSSGRTRLVGETPSGNSMPSRFRMKSRSNSG